MKKTAIAIMILLSIMLAFSACQGKEKEPPCTEHIDNDYNAICDKCGKIVKHEHVFSDEYTYNDEFHYRGTICHDTNYAKDKGDHNLEKRVIVEPSCIEYGKEEYYCTVCDYTKSNIIPMKGHTYDYSAWGYDDSNHWREYTCGCEIEKFSHEWNDGEITTAPTCTSEGVKTYSCKCGAFWTEAVETVPHEISDEYSSDDECHWYSYICGCDDLVERVEHTLTEKRVYTQPTCTEEGQYYQRCTVCYASKYTPIEKIDHTFSEEYDFDRESHWHNSNCGCEGLINGEQAHEFDITNKCLVCNYQLVADDGFIYTLSSDYSEYYLTGLENQEMTEVVVPAQSLGKPVTKILVGAFKDTKIKSVVLPSTITEIASDAFSGCILESITVDEGNARYKSTGGVLIDKNEKTLILGANRSDTTISSGVEIIKDSAFYGCDKIGQVVIPNSVLQIGQNAFYGVCAPVSWDVGTKISEIGSYAFSGYLGAELSLPATVVTIRENAFSNSTAKIALNEGLVTIEGYAFLGCTGITELYLPSSLTTIGKGAFNGCSGITELNVPFVGEGSNASGKASLLGYIFGDSQYEGGTMITQYYTTSSSAKACVPAGLKKITVRGIVLQSGSLQNLNMVEEIVIENGVSEIGDGALRGCSSLEKITIPYIGGSQNPTEETPESVFGHIFGLDSTGTYQYCEGSTGGKRFAIPTSIRDVVVTGGTIKQGAFSNCKFIEKITLPWQGISIIPDNAFYGCTALKSLNIPESVTEFGYHSFQGIDCLEELDIPSTLVLIESYAFYRTSIKRVNISDVDAWCDVELADLPASPLYQTGAKLYLNGEEISGEIIISEGVEKIPYSAFYSCEKITSVSLPASVAEISSCAFYNCTGLKNVNFNEGLKTISTYAFEGAGIKKVILPSTVTSIGTSAFSNCTSLLTASIPAGLTSLGQLSFFNCNKLSEVYNLTTLDEDEITDSYLYMYAKVIHTTNEDSNISYDENGFGFLVVGTNIYLVDYIGTEKDVVLPRTYNGNAYQMGNGVFRNCDITSINTNGAVLVLGDYSFAGSSIQNAVLTGVTEISAGAFEKCAGLTTLTFDSRLESIKESAFAGCTSLKSISFTQTVVTEIAPSLFSGCSSLETVTLHSSTTKIGAQAFHSCSSLTTLENLNRISEIGSGAFYNCQGIKTISFGSIKTIGEQCFMYCTGLEEIGFSSLEEIGNNAFVGCTSLGRLTILHKGAITIGDYAFDGCECLTSIDMVEATIGERAFKGCSSLVISEQNTLLSVGKEAFAGLPLIANVYFFKAAATDIEIGEGAFKGAGVVNLYLPNSVTKIGNSAFEDCKQLKTILYGVAITTLDSDNLIFANAGADDTGIALTLEKKTTAIASNLFYPSTSEDEPKTPKLTKILLEDTSDTTRVTIGDYAFKNCTYLKSFELPIGLSVLGTHAFYGCKSVTAIDYYSRGDFVIDYQAGGWSDTIITTNPFAFVGHDANELELVIKPSVTKIPNGLFFAPLNEEAHITKLTFEQGSTLTEIGEYAFRLSRLLTSVKLPSGVKTIGANAFSCCYAIEEIYVPSTISYIGQNAFLDIEGTLYLGVSSSGSTWAGGWSNNFRGEKVWGYKEN